MTAFRPLTEPIDYFELAGQRSPGVAEIQGADAARDIQERRGYGFGGAYSVYRGIKLVHFKAIVTLTTRDEWDEWHAFTPLLIRPPTGQRARALDIWHPILEDQGINAVLVEKVGQPVPSGDDGWSITIEFAEWRRPTRVLTPAEGAESEQLTPGERAIQAQQSANIAAAAQRDALAGV